MMRTYLVVAGYIGDCCTAIHTRGVVVDAASGAAAALVLTTQLAMDGNEADEQPIVIELTPEQAVLMRKELE